MGQSCRSTTQRFGGDRSSRRPDCRCHSVATHSYRVTLELPGEALDCERVEYQHKGITLEPDGVEEVEIVRDADGRPVGMRKEVYPWAS